MRLLLAAALLATAAAPALAVRPVEFAAQAPQAGALVLPLGSAADLPARGAMLDAGTRAAVERALAAAEFDYQTGSTLALRGLGPWSQILLVGAGTDTVTVAEHHEIGGIAARETAGVDGPVALAAAGLDAAELAIGAGLGGYRFDKYKFVDPAKPRARGLDAPFTVVGGQSPDGTRGRALVEAVHFTRDLINEPANIVYPESFVERTRAAFRGVPNVTIEVLDVPAMERLGMGSILSVGKGSARPPRMLIVRYRGAEAAPVVLAGKGITFDSGGISLKPGAGMWEMKGDMSGAAAVTGAVLSLAKSRAPVHAVAVAALAENMPGGSATRPGDVDVRPGRAAIDEIADEMRAVSGAGRSALHHVLDVGDLGFHFPRPLLVERQAPQQLAAGLAGCRELRREHVVPAEQCGIFIGHRRDLGAGERRHVDDRGRLQLALGI